MRRDYCWKKVGWSWEVWSFDLNDEGKAVASKRMVSLRFWNWRKAAEISNAIFEAYHDGRSVSRQERTEG